MSLENYIKKFQKLRRDYRFGGAPHKPILLISLIEHFEEGLILDNRIYLTAELVESFKYNWATLVTTKHESRFALPFYHLKGDQFWHLQPNFGFEKAIQDKTKMRSIGNLDRALSFAYLDTELFLLLCEQSNRTRLKACLLDTYFPQSKQLYSPINKYHKGLADLERSLLEDSPEAYKSNFKENKDEELNFTRGATFKKLIPKIYNYTCSISGLKLMSTRNFQMIDACHIRQFSECRDDTISNGFALCPNLHRAFDRGIISIDNNYKVIVSEAFNEEIFNPYGIKQLAGKRLLLPKDRKYYPDIANFEWHRGERFLG